MAEDLPEDLFRRFADMVSDGLGLCFSADRRDSLRRGIQSVTAALGYPDASAMARALLASPLTRDQSEAIAMHLTVGETYFFREREALEALRKQELPDRTLRIWCAGCSTGEEAYSVAMILDSIGHASSKILATDINTHALHIATEGVYGPWSFRATPDSLRDRYFTMEADGRSRIDPRIRAMVDFTYHNLARDPFPSLANGTNAMDLILCRNVLFYFRPALRKHVVEGFSRALVDGGWLVVGSVENQQIRSAGLAQTILRNAVLFRKSPGVREPAPPRASHPADKAAGGRVHGHARNQPTHAKPTAHGARKTTAPRPAETPDPAALAGAARDLADKGELETALRNCDAALALDKSNPAYHYLNASILQELGRPEDAAGALRRALYLDKGFVIARFAMGQVARARGRKAEARKHFTTALEMLGPYGESDLLPESEGITAGGLAVTLRHLLQEEVP